MKVFSLDRKGLKILGKVDPGEVRILTAFVGDFYYCKLQRQSNSFVRWVVGGTLQHLKSNIEDGTLLSEDGTPMVHEDGTLLTTEDVFDGQVYTTTNQRLIQTSSGSLLSKNVLLDGLEHIYDEEQYYTQLFYSTKDDAILRYETYLNIHKFKAYVNTGLKEIILKNSALVMFYVKHAPECINLYIKNTGEYHYNVETLGVDEIPLSFHKSLINLDYPVYESLLRVLYLTGMPKLETCYIQIETLVTIYYGPNSPIKDLTIVDYNQVILNMQEAPNIQKFTLINNPSVVLNLTKNYYLSTIYLEKMQSLKVVNLSPLATDLTIKDCQSLVELDLRNDVMISKLLLPDDRELIKVDVRYCTISSDSQAIYNLIDSLYNRYNLEVWGQLIISSIDIVNQWKSFANSKGWYLLNDTLKPTIVFGLGIYPLSFHGDLVGLPAI